jgi:hypothetical protein
VSVILWQKSVHGKGLLYWKCPLSTENPIGLMFLPNNHAGNKFRQAECLVLRHPVMLAE